MGCSTAKSTLTSAAADGVSAAAPVVAYRASVMAGALSLQPRVSGLVVGQVLRECLAAQGVQRNRVRRTRRRR